MITFDKNKLTIEDINSIAQQKTKIKISDEAAYQNRIKAGHEFLNELLKKEGKIYGVTTGYGDSCTTDIPLDLVDELPIQLSRFHGCGMGKTFSHEQARAIMAVRLCSIAKGFSGVTLELLQQIALLLNQDIAPIIPQEGSVGASGDLTPLSYLAAVLMGEREVTYQNKTYSSEELFKKLTITPIQLKPKEALAIMNGTAVMTAIACEAYQRAEYLSQLGARLTAMSVIALHGNYYHYDEKLFSVKPHQGQQKVAAWMRSDLINAMKQSGRIQDRYSLRCAPHVIGVLEDSLPWYRTIIENELNSANDNPIIDPDTKQVLHGGHFYGGHIAAVMDSLKTNVANLADLLDRQMALIMDTKFNRGLPANLSFASKERAPINHGFKAVQIAVSAWTAEALKNSMPASVFSRSTESHNQDKVSMGTIAARDALRTLELTEQVYAAHLLATTQAIAIRLKKNELDKNALSDDIKTMTHDIQSHFELVTEDRPLESTLRQFTTFIQQRRWTLYE